MRTSAYAESDASSGGSRAVTHNGSTEGGCVEKLAGKRQTAKGSGVRRRDARQRDAQLTIPPAFKLINDSTKEKTRALAIVPVLVPLDPAAARTWFITYATAQQVRTATARWCPIFARGVPRTSLRMAVSLLGGNGRKSDHACSVDYVECERYWGEYNQPVTTM